MENLYELFGLPNFSSFADVKSSYQQLAKELHPDKHEQNNTQLSVKETSQQFVTLNEAWKILSNLSAKEQYDAELRQLQTEDNFTINEFISLDELEIDFSECTNCNGSGTCDLCSNRTFLHQCRCGGEYRLLEDDICHKGLPLAIGCGNCSLYIQVSTGL